MADVAPIRLPEVDFLPARFREQQVQRRVTGWQIAVVAAFAGLLGSTAWLQHRSISRLEETAARVRAQHEAATQTARELGGLQQELGGLDAHAALFTYLRHPWPRTQILTAVLRHIPSAITLDEVRVVRENTARPAAPAGAGPSNGAASAEQEKPAPPVADLDKLRREAEATDTVVSVIGRTHDVAALHQFLERVAEEALIARATVHSLERSDDDGEVEVKFEAKIILRKGYSRPAAPPASVPVATEGSAAQAPELDAAARSGNTT
jgi:hypothetical protein